MHFSKVTVFLWFFLAAVVAFADTAAPNPAELFPTQVGKFRRVGPIKPIPMNQEGVLSPTNESVLAGQADYVTGNQRIGVEILRFRQDAEAYSYLSLVAASKSDRKPSIETDPDYGTAGYLSGNELAFFKGVTFVRVSSEKPVDVATLKLLAHSLSETLDAGEKDVPVLLKHFPEPEEARKTAIFLTRFRNIQSLAPNQAVLTALETGGDADAALATLQAGKMLIVEFNTPQLASENDQRIISRIKELWQKGETAPSAYKRVGNYSVFVFDAADEATAKRLIDQVKYEQVVQWLGTNPNILKEAERQYVDMTLGVFLGVLKASGYALVGCLGIGGLIGALLFTRRRSQQRQVEAFSDAGGMLRLNLDELTPQTDPARLLRDRN